ncbi:DUF4126 domain-containing protein [Microbacterium sp. Mu-80]|uniref:DUF4126 domain-containing protein n=1 Tax=Microbacterium bandirmense TaxID=3122050 RepID=A0ABU8L7Q6_9MICO
MLEIVADKIPALDSINDVAQTVIRPAAGGIAFGAGASAQTVAVDDPSVFFADHTWIPIIVGVVIALVVHFTKAAARVAANTVSGGIAAPVLSTAEDGAPFALAAAAIVIPVVALLLLGLIVTAVAMIRRYARRRARRAVQTGET